MTDELVSNWLANGGTACNGAIYGPPNEAVPWCHAGCPLIPRLYRTQSPNEPIPCHLRAVFEQSNLTITDMDAELLRRFDLTELPLDLRLPLREWIYGFPTSSELAIPAGLPLPWLAALPINPRLRNSLRRFYGSKRWKTWSEHPVTCDDFLRFRQVGMTALIELLCVLESVELGFAVISEPTRKPRLRVMTEAQFQAAVGEASQTAIRAASLLGGLLGDFAAWARSETDALTISEAISLATQSLQSVPEWQGIADLQLQNISNAPRHPYDIIESWASDLPEREGHIFEYRINRLAESHTLQELADHLGVTRERVRQLEKRVLTKFTSFTRLALASPVRWRVETIRQVIGTAAPLAQIESLLQPVSGQADYRFTLLRLAGPYDLVDGWIVLKSAADSDPAARIRETANELGYIDLQLAAEELTKWGLGRSYHEEWLTRDGKIRHLNGCLVRWDGSIGDKLVIGLADVGLPATIEELLDHIQADSARTSALNALSIDKRVVRANRTKWALAYWGLPEYSGIASAIRHLLETEGRPISEDELVIRLSADFGVAENSIRVYCRAPIFHLKDGLVHIREDHEPYEYEKDTLHSTRGVFTLEPSRVSLLFQVNDDLLRGSGRALTMTAGAILDVGVNTKLTFASHNGVLVSVTFPETSGLGPSLGSIRSLAEYVGAKLGDQMTVILDRSDMSIEASTTDVSQYEPGWELVARLTGIDANRGIEGLASALNCGEGEVRSLLLDRGDETVYSALPEPPSSLELEQALARLGAQLQQGRA